MLIRDQNPQWCPHLQVKRPEDQATTNIIDRNSQGSQVWPAHNTANLCKRTYRSAGRH